VPRILVADDNSNIQKMVTLALKDEGFEVISVGNGEAAVRKLPEVSPDLVLADIFMPVRSGYEVCEYIKRDPRYAHTPVVLLVGAFDPLDENEAQRVQADGVLKKPFVPPDPLIDMVKALVAKSASERLVAVAVPVAASAEAEHRGAPSPEPVMEEFSDTPPEEFAAPEPAMHLEGLESPLAFSSLLEEPAEEVNTVAQKLPSPPPVAEKSAQNHNEEDAILTAMRDPSLGEPAFWNAPTETAEPTYEEVTEEHTWNDAAPPERHDDAVSLEPAEPNTEPQESAAELPEVEAVEETVAQSEPFVEPLSWLTSTEAEAEPATNPAAAEAAPSEPESVHESSSSIWEFVDEPPASQPAAHEQASVADDIADNPVLEESSSPASPSIEPFSVSEPEPDIEPEPKLSEADARALPPDPELESAAKPYSFADSAEPTLPNAIGVPQTLPVIPPGKPVEAASDAPPAIENPAEAPLAEAPGLVPESEPLIDSEPVPAALASSVPAPAAVTDQAVESSSEYAAPPSPELIDAVVARVLARMQPQVIEIVTREILRPVVEALVHRELDKQ
jgi:CheY-like chemotaxis protein